MKLKYLLYTLLLCLATVINAQKHRISNNNNLLSTADKLANEYKWDDAVNTYQKYIKSLGKAKIPEEVQTKLKQAKMGAQMMNGVEQIVIIDSLVVEKDSFLVKYQLSKDAGLLTTYKQYFKADSDEYGTVYINEIGNRMLFSKGGSLYNSTKLIDKWSAPQILPQPVNVPGEKCNYPFMQSDGSTLSYSSTAESLGGLDIFITSNDSADTYLKPQNIGMPYNSPDNDYMYAIDEINNLGWFASDRRQPDNKVCIYVFIPNKTKKVYDRTTITEKQLINLAEIHSIKDTWVDNDSIVKSGLEKLKNLRDFNTSKSTNTNENNIFIINDNISYTGISEFKSPEAKDLYKHYLQMKNKLLQSQKELEEMRDKFGNADEAQKKEMSPSILNLENKVVQSIQEIKNEQKAIRNKEILYLNK